MNTVRCEGAVCEVLPHCEKRFDGLRERLETGEKELVRLDGEARHLLRSLTALTKAVWAAALSIFGVLCSFVIWYIQHL